MKKCNDECEPLCDFCKNFDSDNWICKIDKTDQMPHDSCEENFECFKIKEEKSKRTKEGFLEYARQSREKNKEFLDEWGND